MTLRSMFGNDALALEMVTKILDTYTVLMVNAFKTMQEFQFCQAITMMLKIFLMIATLGDVKVRSFLSEYISD